MSEFKNQHLKKMGIPRVEPLASQILEAANKALNAGHDKDLIRHVLSKMAANPEGFDQCPEELKEYFAPLLDGLTKLKEGHYPEDAKMPPSQQDGEENTIKQTSGKVSECKNKHLKNVGIPRVEPLFSQTLKVANQALRAGHDKELILHVLGKMAANPEGFDLCPEELKAYFAPLLDGFTKLKEIKASYAERAQIAPWKQWGEQVLDDKTLEQMTNACSLPISVGGALMPDAHTGYGLPVGGVLAVRNAVIPYAVGVDIACRMRLTVLDIPINVLLEDRNRFISVIEKETSFGVNATFAKGLRRHAVLDDDWSVSPITFKNKGKAVQQLGTSGSGNHFVEFGILKITSKTTEPGFSLEPGEYLALLSHSGSRGTGALVADYYSKVARNLHPELPENLAHLAWLDLTSQEGQEYWQAMQLMGRYAAANHELIHHHILKALGAEPLAMVENHHNFAWQETYQGEELIIHRKGATPAALGCLGVVPGSMSSPAFVVKGKGNLDSYNSCSHGAGRKLSRTAAFNELKTERLAEILAQNNVYLISGTLDESPEAYKDIFEVMAAQDDLIDTLARFEPRLVKMSGERPETLPKWQIKRQKKRELKQQKEAALLADGQSPQDECSG